MRVVIAFNPVSGRGTSKDAAGAIEAAMRRAGHEVITVPSTAEPAERWLRDHLQETSLLIVCGGDGTLCAIAPLAGRWGIPLWQAPLGTENLFAQAWGMSRDPDAIVAAVQAWRVRTIDLGHVDSGALGTRTFLLMLSAGLDAHVVLDLARRRRRRITHWTYVCPVLRQLLRYRADIVTVTVDGSTVVDSRPGGVVIANCHRYAAHMDPCPGAVMDDGYLDLTFYPAPSRRAVVAWMRRFRHQSRSTPFAADGAIQVRGRHIVVRSGAPALWQIDGDPFSRDGEGISDLEVSLSTDGVPVLLPVSR